MARIVLDEEDRRLLLRAIRLLEDILETLEVMGDRESMEAVREAEEDLKAGRVRNYDEFIKELRSSGEI